MSPNDLPSAGNKRATRSHSPAGSLGANGESAAEASPAGNHPDDDEPVLPDSVRELQLADGRLLYLVGTAHVSKQSVQDVTDTFHQVRPDTVCVELCAGRHQNLVDREGWRKLDIFKVLREGKAPLLLSSLVMASFQRRIARQLGVEPGAEMLEAIRLADDADSRLVLVDRDIQVTLRRTWGRLGWWRRTKMLFQLLAGLFVVGDLEAEDIEKLKQQDQLEDMLAAMARAFPDVKSTLIDERDIYLAQRIREAPGERLMAVVGAGHVPGILEQIGDQHDLAPLEQLPAPSLLPRVLKWLIPLAVIGLLVVGFFRGGLEESMTSIWLWVVINGALSALGTAIALGHPLTVLSAFVAAPLTSLNPLLAAGWVAGLVQAWIKRPTVRDLENLPDAITSIRGFWSNPLSRILLVVVLANLGSSLGTFIAGGWIAARAL